MKKNLKIFLHFFATAFSVQWEVRCLKGHSTGNGGKTYITMQKIEMCQMEDLYGGDCDMAASFMFAVGTGAAVIPGFQVIAVLGIGLGAIMTATNCGYGKPH